MKQIVQWLEEINGILDIINALKFVNKYISDFGGNSNNITIFGKSGGAWAVSTLLVTPLAKGLFNKVILQSGSFDMTKYSYCISSNELFIGWLYHNNWNAK